MYKKIYKCNSLFQLRFDALGVFKLIVLNTTSSHSTSFTWILIPWPGPNALIDSGEKILFKCKISLIKFQFDSFVNRQKCLQDIVVEKPYSKVKGPRPRQPWIPKSGNGNGTVTKILWAIFHTYLPITFLGIRCFRFLQIKNQSVPARVRKVS